MTDTAAADTERERLEAERDFLLRSLDDLEQERGTGAVDDATYERLHGDYTARAAAAIRALRDGVDARPERAPFQPRRRVVIVAGVIVFAVLAGVALASALGARLPGTTSSGNTGARTPATASVSSQRQQLEAAVARNPQDIPSRMLLARFLEANSDLAGALAQYDQIVKIDPSNADAEAQAGRILYLTAQAAPAGQAADLVNRSRMRLDHAVQLNPQYPDAHFFRAIVLANEFQDYADAQNDAQHYLVLAPNGAFAEQDRALLAQVTNALQPVTPTTTPRKAKP